MFAGYCAVTELFNGWLLLPFLRWWHTALSLISTRWSNGSCTYLRLLGRHLGMAERTSPKAQPGKDWASCLPCHSNSTAWLHNSVRFINNYPISFGQKSFGVIFDDQLTFKEHIAKIARSCRFALHNLRKIRPFLTEHAAQLLVQALVVSRLECSSGWTSIKQNQTSTNDSECSGTTGLQRSQKSPCTPLSISLHWLPVAARIQFKTLMLVNRTTIGGGMIFLPLSRNAGSLSIFKQQLKTHLFQHYLPWKKILSLFLYFHLSLYLSLLPLLACILFKQCLRLGVRGTSSVCLPLQDESLYVFPNCKSLWIKASAKWLNINLFMVVAKIFPCGS